VGGRLAACQRGRSWRLMLLAVAAPIHAKLDETESTQGHSPSVVGM
jgi:hypothetical protein